MLGSGVAQAVGEDGAEARLAAAGALPAAALAQRLGTGLGGVQLGPGASLRLLLASPHDCGCSAAGLGALLTAAGHDAWAVAEL